MKTKFLGFQMTLLPDSALVGFIYIEDKGTEKTAHDFVT